VDARTKPWHDDRAWLGDIDFSVAAMRPGSIESVSEHQPCV